MERPFFPSKFKLVESLREFALQFGLVNNPSWQLNIKAKQERFHFDHFRPFALKHANLVYNPRNNNWILNSTENSRSNCEGINHTHEYHFIHTLGWSLQLAAYLALQAQLQAKYT